MAESEKPSSEHQPENDLHADVPVESDEIELESPRREASAQFVVEGDVGSAAAMREAMDPANQSLTDALRLSFRVLQVIILVLVVLFLFSGVQQVEEGQTGVKLWFGKISGREGDQSLEPGIAWAKLPYPAGEFILFQEANRSVSLNDVFYPRLGLGRTKQDAIDDAQANTQLNPNQQGNLLTRDGDLSHIKFSATYEIDDPVRFVNRIQSEANADRLVKLTMQRAAVQVASRYSLQQLVDLPDEVSSEIKAAAQRMLTEYDCGLRVTNVTITETIPPFAIVKEYRNLTEAREESLELVSNARQDAQRILLEAAGSIHDRLIDRINAYEIALSREDQQQADEILEEINMLMISDDAQGSVSSTIKSAQAYQSLIERTLGQEAQQFASLLPAFRKTPHLIVRRLWYETYQRVMENPDIELVYVPPMGRYDLHITGLEAVQRGRQEQKLKDVELETFSKARRLTRWMRRAADLNKRSRRADITKEGRAVGRGTLGR